MDKFEDFDNKDLITGLQGSSDQVLGEAFVLDTGAALTENDLFTEGSYVVHHVPGVYIMEYHKDPKARTEHFQIKVYDYARQEFEQELREKRDMNEHIADDQKVVYHVAPWIIADLLMNHDVHPQQDEAAFEKKLWELYPGCWLNEAKAPRH